MAELKTEGNELKKFVKMARNRELPFAFCPGAGEEEPMIAIHRTKKPDAMGKAARKESEQTKVAFGTMAVEGKTVKITCERVVPGMQKKLKKYFRSQKVPLDVVLLDAEGNELS